MHVNARKIALSGVLAAFAVVLIVLGSIFETSTLFLLAAAAFCVGIVVREWGIAYGLSLIHILNYKRTFFDRYSQISIEKLITSRTIEEFVDNLQGTEYYEPLRKLRDSNASTLFDYCLLYTSREVIYDSGK